MPTNRNNVSVEGIVIDGIIVNNVKYIDNTCMIAHNKEDLQKLKLVWNSLLIIPNMILSKQKDFEDTAIKVRGIAESKNSYTAWPWGHPKGAFDGDILGNLFLN